MGHVLREARKAAGLTQADLARMLGVVTSRVCQLEHGRPILPHLFRKLPVEIRRQLLDDQIAKLTAARDALK